MDLRARTVYKVRELCESLPHRHTNYEKQMRNCKRIPPPIEKGREKKCPGSA
jgi:hypothetical protein